MITWSVQATWVGEETKATFTAVASRSSFTDEHSGTFIDDIQIDSVVWFGHEMLVAELPEEVQKCLFEIADDLEWEGV